ncbi:uncharacterized protein BDZ83DRAFT_645289 [Colletotrichum acutatum]|uniref:Uncharacterized protein n=1 Tax=Glomerella acutata TaxID=27357 RepID=A0AAD8U6A9_GLOAC|nr:uncharacterized protein BDZ83DRAFT_645289 [Colletotrichum acutatum]KAK1702483.1 hypothetical protein BDZ83DRAFT_645289 [Colletotrichum acutatum]
MNDHEIFRRLATYPFTSATLKMLQCALQVIQKRYPLASLQDGGDAILEYPSQEAFEQTEVPLHVTGEWISLMKIVGDSIDAPEQRVPLPLRLFARGEQADVDMIAEYLRLLRPAYPSFHFSDPVIFTSDNTETAARLYGTFDATTLIPCSYDGAWFAAVAYADCVQLYGAQVESSSKLEQQAQTLFPGRTICFSEPLVTTPVKDPGALMLLSLRMLAGGGVPTMCADAAFLQNLRARICVELLAQNLDVRDSDVSERLQQVQLENSTFFDEAFIREDNSPSPVGSTFTADMGSNIGPSTFGASPSPSRLFSPVGEGPPSAGRGSSETTSASPKDLYRPSLFSRAVGPSPKWHVFGTRIHGVSHSVSPPMPPPMPEECRVILGMLSEAVAFYRSSRLSGSTELAVMWSAIKSGSKSEFYRRYIGLLFYEEMARLSSDQEVALRLKTSITKRELGEMRRHQSDFQIWHDICDLRRDWGPGRFVLLCALPESFQVGRGSRTEKQVQLRRVCKRLQDDRDPLSGYLDVAKELCAALVQVNLPCERLMIDDYHLKAYSEMSEPEFAAYMSLSPRPVIPISRWGTH